MQWRGGYMIAMGILGQTVGIGPEGLAIVD
jgi:hypothetical protein